MKEPINRMRKNPRMKSKRSGRIVAMICMALVVAIGVSAHPADAAGPGKVKAITCTKATTTSLTIKYSKSKRAKAYQIRYKAKNGKWKYRKTKKRVIKIKDLKKASAYTVQVRGIRRRAKGKWKTRKLYTPHVKIVIKDTSGRPVSGVTFVVKRSGKTYTARTNSKGIAKVGVPVGSYTVKMRTKSGYAASSKTVKATVKKGNGKTLKWSIRKKSTPSKPSGTANSDDDWYLGYSRYSYYMNNSDEDMLKKVLVWNEQQVSSNADINVFPWSDAVCDDYTYERLDKWPEGEEIITHAKNKYGLNNNSPEFEKSIYIAQSVCDLWSYSQNSTSGDHLTACGGYSSLYQYALNKMGVPCYYVTSDNANHSWNIVKLGSSYYLVDVTWMDKERIVANGVTYENQFYDRSRCLLKSSANFDNHPVLPNSCPIKCTNTSYDNYDWSDWPFERRYYKKWI